MSCLYDSFVNVNILSHQYHQIILTNLTALSHLMSPDNSPERHSRPRISPRRHRDRSVSPRRHRDKSVSPRHRPRNLDTRSSLSHHRNTNSDSRIDRNEQEKWGSESQPPQNEEFVHVPCIELIFRIIETKKEKKKPDFGLSGALAADQNTFKGVILKYSEPPEARKYDKNSRLYVFKGKEQIGTKVFTL